MKSGWVFKMLSSQTITWMCDNDYAPNDINKVGQYGNSALMKSVREANSDIAKELIEAGANLELKNIDGNTALWNACFGEDYACVEVLVKAGIELNSMNDNGVTALMYAASTGKEAIVRLLLSYRADTELVNLDGFKAIDLAVTPKIYKMLKWVNNGHYWR